MKHTARLLAAAAFAAAISAQSSAPAAKDGAPAAAPAAAPPRLVVLCSIDQLASWVLDQTLPHCGEGGFRRLLREGVAFPECAYLHGCTETGPGHATLGTGAPARVHGIARNEWIDAATNAKVYCAGEPVPALAEFPEGKDRGPGRLLVPTLGDLLKQRDANSLVVSLSIKDRAAILMAGGAADAVAWFEVASGRFVTNTRWGKTAPAWLLAFDAKKPADAMFGWNWTRCAPDAAYADCVDDQPFEMPHPSSGARTLPVAIHGAKGRDEPGYAFYYEAYLSPIANELTLQAAEAALAGTALGRDDVPDLLCVSFSGTDLVGHTFGPESVEARDTMLRLDALLTKLMQDLDRDVGVGRWAFVLSADHGVGHTPEYAKAKGEDAGRGSLHAYAKAAAEKALREHFAVAEGDKAPLVQAAFEFMLVLDRAAIARAAAAQGQSDAAVAFRTACDVAAAAAGKARAVHAAYATAELLEHGGGDDPVRRAMWQAACAGRSGDVMLVFKQGWLEGATPASHGSPFDYDRRVPLLACGPGLAVGTALQASVSPGLATQIAARLLGLPPLAASVDAMPAGTFVR